ncbi:Putative auto-transporter adhesin, head GIN domain [Pricia antarctica]|uniref:Putative auto-transporter adhesin, head GIN domain n=1 Tax=Pricia antarctica TaxID=641691 RepID=A0A1G7GQK7_9FLAO|nr:head GIN domain-containing protein [Pricia antarctica]SDE90430.1 Putative auto-transporter adhesin, head GIN domain [Pricia antarctica]
MKIGILRRGRNTSPLEGSPTRKARLIGWQRGVSVKGVATLKKNNNPENSVASLNGHVEINKRNYQSSFFPGYRNHVYIIFILLFASCNTENAPDCLQNSGNLIREEVALSEFTKITVFENVALVLKQGGVQKVEIATGEYLRDEVSATVEGDRLLIKDTNDCNYFREYGLTTVYITSPNITEIRSSTGQLIKSDGVLAYANLTLLSESFNNPESETTDGEFDLEVDTQNLGVVVNGIAYFQLKGKTENLRLTIAAGDSRIEAGNLTAQSVSLNHRGANDMFVNPQRNISGTIRGTGDVISSNRPDTVAVEALYKGRLIFR